MRSQTEKRGRTIIRSVRNARPRRSCSSGSCCRCGGKSSRSCSKSSCSGKSSKSCDKRCCPCPGPTEITTSTVPTVLVTTKTVSNKSPTEITTSTVPTILVTVSNKISAPETTISSTLVTSTEESPHWTTSSATVEHSSRKGVTFDNQTMRQNSSAGSIAAGVVVPLLIVGLGTLVFVVWWRKRKKNSRDGEKDFNKADLKVDGLDKSLDQPVYYSIDEAFPKNGPYEKDHVYSSIKQDYGVVDELVNGLNSGLIQEGQVLKLPDNYDHLSRMKTTLGQNAALSDSERACRTREEKQNFQNDTGHFVLEKDFSGRKTTLRQNEVIGGSTGANTSREEEQNLQNDTGYSVLEKNFSGSTRASTTRCDAQNPQDDRGYFVLEKNFSGTGIADDAQMNRNQKYEHLVEPETSGNSDTYSKLNIL